MMGTTKEALMPRETIHSNTPNPGVGPAPFVMQVGWNRDMDVQVGIATPDGGAGQLHLVDYIYADEQTLIGKTLNGLIEGTGRSITDGSYDAMNPAHDVEFTNELLGRMVLDAVTGSTPFGTSVWWHPDRDQTNRLIRLLRKARDAAFGRDE